MDVEELSEEQKVQFREAKSPEKILAVGEETRFELSLDELDSVAGGVRGRRKYEPRRHIGPDAKRED